MMGTSEHEMREHISQLEKTQADLMEHIRTLQEELRAWRAGSRELSENYEAMREERDLWHKVADERALEIIRLRALIPDKECI